MIGFDLGFGRIVWVVGLSVAFLLLWFIVFEVLFCCAGLRFSCLFVSLDIAYGW